MQYYNIIHMFKHNFASFYLFVTILNFIFWYKIGFIFKESIFNIFSIVWWKWSFYLENWKERYNHVLMFLCITIRSSSFNPLHSYVTI